MRINSTKQLAVFLGIIGAAILLTTLSFAESGQRFNNEEAKKGWQEKKAKMMATLNLTEEQQQALKAHKTSHRKEKKAMREQIKAKRQELHKAIQNPAVDENTIIAMNNEIKQLMDKMSDHRLKGILEVRKILTPEQFQKFTEFKKQNKGMRKKGYWRKDRE